MILLSILSAMKRFFYVCVKWILENKRWTLIIILLICCLFQSCQLNNQAGQIKNLKQQHADHITQQKLAAEKAKVQAAQQERRCAKLRMSEAPRETVIEYSNTNSDVLEACTAEYRFMAQKADEHAADAERLIKAWPEK